MPKPFLLNDIMLKQLDTYCKTHKVSRVEALQLAVVMLWQATDATHVVYEFSETKQLRVNMSNETR
jgi:hypothetical protein